MLSAWPETRAPQTVTTLSPLASRVWPSSTRACWDGRSARKTFPTMTGCASTCGTRGSPTSFSSISRPWCVCIARIATTAPLMTSNRSPVSPRRPSSSTSPRTPNCLPKSAAVGTFASIGQVWLSPLIGSGLSITSSGVPVRSASGGRQLVGNRCIARCWVVVGCTAGSAQAVQPHRVSATLPRMPRGALQGGLCRPVDQGLGVIP